MGYLFTKAKKALKLKMEKSSHGGAKARGSLREEFLTTNHTNDTNLINQRRNSHGGH